MSFPLPSLLRGMRRFIAFKIEEVRGPNAFLSGKNAACRDDRSDTPARRLHVSQPDAQKVLPAVPRLPNKGRGLDAARLQEGFEACQPGRRVDRGTWPQIYLSHHGFLSAVAEDLEEAAARILHTCNVLRAYAEGRQPTADHDEVASRGWKLIRSVTAQVRNSDTPEKIAALEKLVGDQNKTHPPRRRGRSA